MKYERHREFKGSFKDSQRKCKYMYSVLNCNSCIQNPRNRDFSIANACTLATIHN